MKKREKIISLYPKCLKLHYPKSFWKMLDIRKEFFFSVLHPNLLMSEIWLMSLVNGLWIHWIETPLKFCSHYIVWREWFWPQILLSCQQTCYHSANYLFFHLSLPKIYRYWIKHGPRTPNQAFFHWNTKHLGLATQFGQIHFGAFEVFSADLSAPILVLWVPCPCFPLFNHYFYKKLSLYIHIPNIYLGLEFEFEFGLQRIRDLAFVCP